MTIKHNTTFSALPPFRDDRYLSFSWPEDIQPHEAELMGELFVLQFETIKRIAANNVQKESANDEYESWGKRSTEGACA